VGPLLHVQTIYFCCAFSTLLHRFAVDVGGFVKSSDLSIFKNTTLVDLEKLLICVMQITYSLLKGLADLEKL
jgi:hypothetical protein